MEAKTSEEIDHIVISRNPNQGVLLDPREEKLCQLIAERMVPLAGATKSRARKQAFLDAGYKSTNQRTILDRTEVIARIATLKMRRALRAEYTPSLVLEHTMEIIEMAKAEGQYGHALAGLKMLGAECYNMFMKEGPKPIVDQLAVKTKEELLSYIVGELRDLGLNAKMIEGSVAEVVDDDDHPQPKADNPAPQENTAKAGVDNRKVDSADQKDSQS